MKRIIFVILLVMACQGCTLFYLNKLASKCAAGNMREGEVISGDSQVRVVCKDRQLQRLNP